MKTLRRGRETLLTLLEAFVYDPLLDWTGNDTGIIASFYGGGAGPVAPPTDPLNPSATQKLNTKESRRSMEKKMTHRLLKIRLIENRSLAEKNQDNLMKMLEKLEAVVSSLCESMNKRENKEDLLRLYEQAKIYLDESLTLHSDTKTKGASQHPVYSLHDRYETYLTYQQSVNRVVTLNQSVMDSFYEISTQYSSSIDFIESVEQLLKSKNETENVRLIFQMTLTLSLPKICINNLLLIVNSSRIVK